MKKSIAVSPTVRGLVIALAFPTSFAAAAQFLLLGGPGPHRHAITTKSEKAQQSFGE